MHHRSDEHGYKGKQPALKPNPQLRGVGSEINQGNSYKQRLVNGKNHIHKGGNKENTKKKLIETQILEGTMEVLVVEENLKKYEKCWVGKLWDQQDVDKIQFKIWMEGFQMVNVIPLGLDLMLLTSDTHDGVKNAVESNSDWWSRCFIEIRPWNPLLRPRGRRVWVRIYGTPLHVWGEDCFNKVVYNFSKLIRMDEATKDQRRLDYARVEVHINGWETVDKLVDIRVGGDLFVLRVVEEHVAVDGKNNDGGLGSTKWLESNASIGTPDRRWIGDDDGLNGDWSGGSLPERPLRLSLNVSGFGPVDNNIQKAILSDTPNSVPSVPVAVCIGGEEGDLQEKSSAPLHQSPIKGMKEGVVVESDLIFEEGGEEAAVSEGCCEKGHSQHLMGMGDEVMGNGGVAEVLRKEELVMGQVPIGPSGVEKEKADKGVELGGEDGLLLKGSCSGWAQNNKFGPLNLVVQHEGGVVERDSDSEVLRLGRLEEANGGGPLVEGSVCKGPIQYGRRKGGLNSKKNNKNAQKQGATKCVRFANAVKNSRRPKHDRRGTSSLTPSVDETQASDPIQDPTDFAVNEVGAAVLELSDMNSFNNNSIIDGNQRCDMEPEVSNFRIEAERLFNIGMNLGISSNEDKIALVERLMESNGADVEVGDVEVDQ
ncbi:hypothetical protein P8452_15693 [Trifolium repens]|nr:hypothetical protein P8452_15693 [Trifolium repens]